MRLRVYLPLAIAAFLLATTGADLFARVSIAGRTLAVAWREHWSYTGPFDTIFMAAPFLAVAGICAYAAKWTRARSVTAIFALSMSALLFFYFEGHQASQHALLEERWTAAALSVGLLPFLIGIPVVLIALGASAIAAKLDRRIPI